jgi:hypothetical protein
MQPRMWTFAPKTMLAVLAAVVFSAVIDGRAEAAQIRAWLVESNQPDDVRQLDLWLQSDANIDFLIRIDGDGIVDGSGKSNSPETATYSLTAGQADKAWSYGSTLAPPGAIDETVELHKTPTDVFSDAPTPLLAKFAFQRKIPADEKTPPTALAKKQCATLQ